MLNKQFSNLGKPILLEGIGSLSKKNTGIYEFTQVNKVVIQQETPSDFETKKQAELEHEKTHKKSNGFNYLLITVMIIVVALLLYFILQKPSNSIQQDKLDNPAVIEKIDTLNSINDSVVKSNLDPNLYIKNFKIIVRNYNSLRKAEKGLKSLSKKSYGKNLMMYTKDSVRFFLALPISANLNDTTKIKDSIIKLFGKTVTMDLE